MNPLEGRDAFEGEVFEGLDLQNTDLGGREFTKCVFRHSKLQETRWSRSRLDECIFEECDLTRADPTMLRLRDVTFRSSKLMGVDFSNVGKYPHVRFEDCNLRYISVVSVCLRSTRFVRCGIEDANFFEADLGGATFEECRFAEARFDRCELKKASFPSARDLFIDPARNGVKGTQIPLETALALAASFGMRVLGFSPTT